MRFWKAAQRRLVDIDAFVMHTNSLIATRRARLRSGLRECHRSHRNSSSGLLNAALTSPALLVAFTMEFIWWILGAITIIAAFLAIRSSLRQHQVALAVRYSALLGVNQTSRPIGREHVISDLLARRDKDHDGCSSRQNVFSVWTSRLPRRCRRVDEHERDCGEHRVPEGGLESVPY